MPRTGSRPRRSSLPGPPLFFSSMLLLSCGLGAGGGSACDGLSGRRMGIAREEYRPCAGEIVATLDALRLELERIADGDTAALGPARKTSRELRVRIRQTGIETDYRSFRPGVVFERWPDGDLRAFNGYVFDAAFQYSTFLASSSDRTSSRLHQGVKAHEAARDAYRRFD